MRRPHKYGARKSGCYQGHTHPSVKEADRCNQLHLLQRAGAISNLEIQPQFWFVINGRQVKHPNGRRVGYKPDFRYQENGVDIVEDVKGMRTDEYILRSAIFRALFPAIEFRES